MCNSVDDFKFVCHQSLMGMFGRYLELPEIKYHEFVRICGILSYANAVGIMTNEEYQTHFSAVADAYSERAV